MADYSDSLDKIAELIGGIHIAMITTVEADGELRSRPMGSQGFDDDGTLVFFTNAHGSLSEEAAGRTVNVAYADIGKNTYVSIGGHGAIDRDRAAIERHWKPQFKAWFPNGIDDPELVILRVTIDRAEYWDSPSGPIVTIKEFFKAATGAPTSFGDHAKINV